MADDKCELYQDISSYRGHKGAFGTWTRQKALNTKIHLVAETNGMPVGIIVTAGSRADYKEVVYLIEDTEVLLAGHGCDTSNILFNLLKEVL